MSSRRIGDTIDGYKMRCAERTVVNSPTRLTQQNWYMVDVIVRDVSTAGFMVQCQDNVSIGSYVCLDVPGLGPVRAQVRWQVGGRMGGMFLDPIRMGHCEWSAQRADAPQDAA